MTATGVRSTTVTRHKIMVERKTAARRAILVETTAGTRLETAAETIQAISPGVLTRTAVAAKVAAATMATIIMDDRPPAAERIFCPQKSSVLRRIAGRPAALPQNCLTTEGKSRTALAFRPRHFSNIYCLANISFLHKRLAGDRNFYGAKSSNQFARIVGSLSQFPGRQI